MKKIMKILNLKKLLPEYIQDTPIIKKEDIKKQRDETQINN